MDTTETSSDSRANYIHIKYFHSVRCSLFIKRRLCTKIIIYFNTKLNFRYLHIFLKYYNFSLHSLTLGTHNTSSPALWRTRTEKFHYFDPRDVQCSYLVPVNTATLAHCYRKIIIPIGAHGTHTQQQHTNTIIPSVALVNVGQRTEGLPTRKGLIELPVVKLTLRVSAHYRGPLKLVTAVLKSPQLIMLCYSWSNFISKYQ